MSPYLLSIIVALVGLVLGLLVGYIYRKNVSEKTIGSAEQKAKNLILDAENRSEALRKEMLQDAKDEANRLRKNLDREIKDRRSEMQRSEKRLMQKEEAIDRKLEGMEQKEREISSKMEAVEEKNKEVDAFLEKQIAALEQISELTKDEAKDILLKEIEKDVRVDAAKMIKEIETEAKETGEKKAREIITTAIQRCAADHVAESTVSVVNLPSDDMKGRIIGREGRNIRVLETLTGVDLIIDDTPEAVILSGFDPVRREIARIALEKLIMDGRIHPTRIEEMVEKAKKEVAQIIKEEGEKATFEVGIHNLHVELVKILGRLKYRTSYGQNVLKHSIEVSHLAGLMAGMLDLDVKLAKRAGLLHDIGKALDHEYEGTHVEIGIDLLKRFKEHPLVINAVAAHHGDYEPQSMEAILVAAADALSAARPGARRETLEVYIKRLEKLENIANTTDGVEKAYAIQAGREIRIIAKPEAVRDEEMPLLAREIAKKIEGDLDYPGQIKVNVVRETRAIDFAR